MAKNTVQLTGMHVQMAPDGTYHMAVFWRLEVGRMHQEEHSGLSWPEALTVLVELLDCHRPGWSLGDGWHQPALPLD